MRKVALEKSKQTLLETRDRLAGEVTHLIEMVPEKASGGDLSHVPTHNADRDSEGLDSDLEVIQKEESMLAEVRDALQRIDQGTYGVCEECEQEIDDARLEALPHTPYCIQCAQKVGSAM